MHPLNFSSGRTRANCTRKIGAHANSRAVRMCDRDVTWLKWMQWDGSSPSESDSAIRPVLDAIDFAGTIYKPNRIDEKALDYRVRRDKKRKLSYRTAEIARVVDWLIVSSMTTTCLYNANSPGNPPKIRTDLISSHTTSPWATFLLLTEAVYLH